MLKNKKGGISNILTTFYACVLIILIFTVFYILFNVSGKITVMQINSAYSSDINTNTQLLGILRSPVNVNEAQLTMADIIILAQKEQCKTKDDNKEGNPYCQALYSNLSIFTDKWTMKIDELEFGEACLKKDMPELKLPYEGKQVSVTLCKR